jgi:C_GCAxxG_C_C family probable redox protein
VSSLLRIKRNNKKIKGGWIMSQKLSRDELLIRIQKSAHDHEYEFHGCSRCVLKALQDHLNLGNDVSLKASTPLAGGVALRGEVCGALLGGLLAVGMVTANEDMKDSGGLFSSLSVGFRLAKKVEKELGSTTCAEIQKIGLGRSYNLADGEQYKEFVEAGGYTHCSKVVGQIARMSAESILDFLEKR